MTVKQTSWIKVSFCEDTARNGETGSNQAVVYNVKLQFHETTAVISDRNNTTKWRSPRGRTKWRLS